MLGFTFKYEDTTAKVVEAVEKAGFKNISHAAASIRKTAIASIRPGDGPSAPGTPPHTTNKVTKKGKVRKGKLPRAIRFDVDKEANEAIIGPLHSVIGDVGEAHEFGGVLTVSTKKGNRSTTYPERPYMGPALESEESRFGDSFAGSIGG